MRSKILILSFLLAVAVFGMFLLLCMGKGESPTPVAIHMLGTATLDFEYRKGCQNVLAVRAEKIAYVSDTRLLKVRVAALGGSTFIREYPQEIGGGLLLGREDLALYDEKEGKLVLFRGYMRDEPPVPTVVEGVPKDCYYPSNVCARYFSSKWWCLVSPSAVLLFSRETGKVVEIQGSYAERTLVCVGDDFALMSTGGSDSSIMDYGLASRSAVAIRPQSLRLAMLSDANPEWKPLDTISKEPCYYTAPPDILARMVVISRRMAIGSEIESSVLMISDDGKSTLHATFVGSAGVAEGTSRFFFCVENSDGKLNFFDKELRPFSSSVWGAERESTEDPLAFCRDGALWLMKGEPPVKAALLLRGVRQQVIDSGYNSPWPSTSAIPYVSDNNILVLDEPFGNADYFGENVKSRVTILKVSGDCILGALSQSAFPFIQ